MKCRNHGGKDFTSQLMNTQSDVMIVWEIIACIFRMDERGTGYVLPQEWSQRTAVLPAVNCRQTRDSMNERQAGKTSYVTWVDRPVSSGLLYLVSLEQNV